MRIPATWRCATVLEDVSPQAVIGRSRPMVSWSKGEEVVVEQGDNGGCYNYTVRNADLMKYKFETYLGHMADCEWLNFTKENQ